MILDFVLGLFGFLAFSAAFVRWGNTGEFVASAVACAVIAYNVTTVAWLVGALQDIVNPTPARLQPGPSPLEFLLRPPRGLLILAFFDAGILFALSDGFRETGIPDALGGFVSPFLTFFGTITLAVWDALTRLVLALL